MSFIVDCRTCQYEAANGPLDFTKTNAELARETGLGKDSIRRHRKHTMTTVEQAIAYDQEFVDDKHDPVNGSSYTRMAATAWGENEWREFLRAKGTDPDTVTFTFGVTSNPHGGYWNKLLNVRPKPQPIDETVDWEAAAKFIEGFTYVPAKRDHLVNTAILQPTDEQWGKTDFNGGTPQTEERVLNSYAAFADYCREYRPRQIALLRTGDGIENTCSTNSQRDTNDLDVPHQIVQSFKIDLQGLAMLAPLAEEVIDARVTSNHGRWRTGLKADAGNPHADFGIAVGRQLEDTQRVLGVLPNVKFLFPDALMESMTVQLDTIRAGMTHGHLASSPDRMGDWWAKQDHGRMPTWDADILFVGHWHSMRIYQSGDGRWVVVGPASDNGSSWFSNIRGERARSGMLAMSIEGKRWRFQEIL